MWVSEQTILEDKRSDASNPHSMLRRLLENRRAIKHFNSAVTVSDHLIEDIIQLASLTPSAFNLQPWRVLQIKSESIRAQVIQHGYHQLQLIHAPVLLAIVWEGCAWRMRESPNFTDQLSVQEWAKAETLYRDKPILARDEAIRGAAMFSMTLMLAAEASGLQSCPLTGCDFEAIQKTLNLSESQELCMLLAIGKAAHNNAPRARYRMNIRHYFSEI